MDHVTKYRSADLKRRRQLRQFTGVTTPEDLRAELGMARLLCQEAFDQGQAGLANALLTAIGKLAHVQTVLKKANTEFVEREELRRLVGQMCEIVVQAIEGKFPNWEETVDQIGDALLKVANESPEEEPHE